MWQQSLTRVFLCALIVALGACSSITERNRSSTSMEDIKDGEPNVLIDLSHIKEPTPSPVIRTVAGNKSPYVVLGKSYTVLPDSSGFRQRGNASWYGTKFHGKPTSNGEIYNMYAMTAAHRTLPIPSYVKVTNLNNQRSIIVRVNDRGPFHSDRIIDLSYAAARKLGYAKVGVAPVIVEDVTPQITGAEVIAEQSADRLPTITTATADVTDYDKTIDSGKAKEHELPSVNPAPAYLQVGAFKERQAAERLRTKLMGVVDYPVAVAQGYDAWYRVRIGPVYTSQSIAYLSDDLKRQGHAEPLIVYD